MKELSKSDLLKHYIRPEIREIIQKLSSFEGFHRCGNGDGVGWYHNGEFKRSWKESPRYHIDLTTKEGYDFLIKHYRTLYWSLNFFNPELFTLNYKEISNKDSPTLSRKYTRAYTFGVDVDTKNKTGEHGLNIAVPKVKRAVEAMGQYTANRIREFAPNGVNCLFSGGGVYVLIHHRAFTRFFTEYKEGKEGLDFDYWLEVLIDAVNAFLSDIYEDFKAEYPEHAEYAKMDLLNNAKRVFKAPYSIHKRHPYAVIPLDPENVLIDFEQATIPLKDQVLERGKSWYTTFDTDSRLLKHLEQHYFKRAEESVTDHSYKIRNTELEISPLPIRDNWPPCIKNMLALKTCEEGATRALFFLSTFLGQVGIPEQEAQEIFYGLAKRWDKPTANIFETKFRLLHCPNCETLRSPDNTGYPRGKSILHLGICKPDTRCIGLQKKNPRYYADKAGYLAYLRNRLRGSNGPKQDTPGKQATPDTAQPRKYVINVTDTDWLCNSEIPADHVYIGREYHWWAKGGKRYNFKKSKWGNPFKEDKPGKKRDGTLEEILVKHREDLLKKDELLEALPELFGKTLVCWCKPDPCHGDTLARYADIVFEATQAAGRKLSADEIRKILTWSEVTP